MFIIHFFLNRAQSVIFKTPLLNQNSNFYEITIDQNFKKIKHSSSLPLNSHLIDSKVDSNENSVFSESNKKTSSVNHQNQTMNELSQSTNVGYNLSFSGSDFGIKTNYPRISRILKESGHVIVEFNLNESPPIKIIESSHYERLDRSALDSAQDALDSGLIAQALKDKQSIRIIFIFKLNDYDQ